MAGEAGPKFRTVFSRESCGEFQKYRYSCARFLRKTPPPGVGGVSGWHSVKVNIFPRISVKVALWLKVKVHAVRLKKLAPEISS